MTVQQLKNKHKRRRAMERRRGIVNGIVIITVSLLIGTMVYTGLCKWSDNLDTHAEYNRQFIQDMERGQY